MEKKLFNMGILNLYDKRMQIEKLGRKMVKPNDFSSITNKNCSKLQELLQADKWREADNETFAIMLRTTNREKEGWLDSEHLEQLSDSDLNTINQLWVTYSNKHFGFSIQKSLWQRSKHNFIWDVGWISIKPGFYAPQGEFYSPEIFDIKAPQGHLPRCILINSIKINFLNGKFNNRLFRFSWGHSSPMGWTDKGNTRDNASGRFYESYLHDNWQKDLECIFSREYLE
jgi:hypothetical protein